MNRGGLEPEPSLKDRLAVADTPMMVAAIALGAVALLAAIRRGFRGLVVQLPGT